MQEDRPNGPVSPARFTEPRRPKPYLSAQELAELTPWSEQAIKDMMRAGKLLEGTLFFRVGRRIVFKWDAVVDLIESNAVGKIRSPLKGGPVAGGREACAPAERRVRFTRREGAQGGHVGG